MTFRFLIRSYGMFADSLKDIQSLTHAYILIMSFSKVYQISYKTFLSQPLNTHTDSPQCFQSRKYFICHALRLRTR